MAPKTKVALANGLMAAGLVPYLVVLGYMVWTSTLRGDAALGAVFMIILGLGVSYVVAVIVAWPACWWSRSLAQSLGNDARLSIVLRGAVMCGVFPLLAVFPFLAFAVLR